MASSSVSEADQPHPEEEEMVRDECDPAVSGAPPANHGVDAAPPGPHGLNIYNNKEIRIVLVGKTGAGKSTTGNTILGEKKFKSKFSFKSLTKHCDKAFGEVDGQQVAVIDTPGLFDTCEDEEKTKQDIAQCISYASPGPHIFLVVIRLGRFTEEEKKTVQKIQQIFGEEADKYSMVLFTHGDLLKEEPIEELLKEDKDLQELVSRCNGQYHVFNNELKDRSQVRELLNKIRNITEKNGGRHYTTEMFQEAEKKIEEEKQRILRENEEQRRKELEELKKEIEKKYEEKMRKMKADREKQSKLMAERKKELEKEKQLKEACERELEKEKQLKEARERELEMQEKQLKEARERELEMKKQQKEARERELEKENKLKEACERELEKEKQLKEARERELEKENKLKEACERVLEKERQLKEAEKRLSEEDKKLKETEKRLSEEKSKEAERLQKEHDKEARRKAEKSAVPGLLKWMGIGAVTGGGVAAMIGSGILAGTGVGAVAGLGIGAIVALCK